MFHGDESRDRLQPVFDTYFFLRARIQMIAMTNATSSRMMTTRNCYFSASVTGSGPAV